MLMEFKSKIFLDDFFILYFLFTFLFKNIIGISIIKNYFILGFVDFFSVVLQNMQGNFINL